MKRLHYFSGLVLTIFISFHLTNHAISVSGAQKHIDVMNTFRLFYRNIFVEAILLFAVVVQIASGISLLLKNRGVSTRWFDKLHWWTGMYLAIFLAIHVSVVLIGRSLLNLDTNYYFGVAGLNTFPLLLFFIPYYGLAIVSFFGHVAAIHSKKMTRSVSGVSPQGQAKVILLIGVCLTILIFYGLTDHFTGVEIPPTYNILIGK